MCKNKVMIKDNELIDNSILYEDKNEGVILIQLTDELLLDVNTNRKSKVNIIDKIPTELKTISRENIQSITNELLTKAKVKIEQINEDLFSVKLGEEVLKINLASRRLALYENNKNKGKARKGVRKVEQNTYTSNNKINESWGSGLVVGVANR